MESKVVSGIMLTLLLIGMLTLAFNIQPVKSDWTWTETIYIRADGSVYPDAAPISTVDNITYTLTDNIVGAVLDVFQAIVVERDNIVVDGAGYTLQCTIRDGTGIALWGRSNVTIKNMKIEGFFYSIVLYGSSNNTVSGNNITNNDYAGILLEYSSNNTISGNNITNNDYAGIWLVHSSNNKFYHNNMIDNTQHVNFKTSYVNYWDDGVEGNYWSNYTGVDSNHDGIGDTVHNIGTNNTDHYPLMGMFHSFNTSLGYNVNVISNSTIEDFQYFESNSTIKMYVSNMTANQTFGFCRVCIPHTLMDPNNIWVVIDGGQTEVLFANFTLYDNTTHRWIYFAYPHSTHEVIIGEARADTAVYFNLSPNPVGVGETLTLRGIFVDEFSEPIPSETVRLYYRSLTGGSWNYITSLTTNDYGIVMWQVTIPPSVMGTLIVAVYYPGSEMYESTYNLAILVVQ